MHTLTFALTMEHSHVETRSSPSGGSAVPWHQCMSCGHALDQGQGGGCVTSNHHQSLRAHLRIVSNSEDIIARTLRSVRYVLQCFAYCFA